MVRLICVGILIGLGGCLQEPAGGSSFIVTGTFEHARVYQVQAGSSLLQAIDTVPLPSSVLAIRDGRYSEEPAIISCPAPIYIPTNVDPDSALILPGTVFTGQLYIHDSAEVDGFHVTSIVIYATSRSGNLAACSYKLIFP